MLGIINTIFILIFLFYILGKSADKIVFNARIIAEKLGIPIVFLGAILGFLTSIPETAIGINAIIKNIPSIAFGNLLGGIIVILCLVLGLNLVLNRKINTDGEVRHILPIFFLIFLPILLSTDGKLGYIDGLIIITTYFLVLYYLYVKEVNFSIGHISTSRGGHMAKEWMYLIISAVIIVVASNLILKETTLLLQQIKISPFIIGLVFFSLGTNLPEIAVMFRSWKRGASKLSVSHLLGSAMANVLIIGIFSVIKTTTIQINTSFFLLVGFIFLAVMMVLLFYKTQKKLSRTEGIMLLIVYTVFVISQIYYSN